MKKEILNQTELSRLCLELSLLLHAGVMGADALSLLAEGEREGSVRALLSAAAEAADCGAPMSQALRDTGAFPAYLCGLLEVGEQSGRLEEALSALSQYYEDRARMERRLKSALLYPAVMLCLMLAVIGVLLVKVLPIFDDVYASLGGRLTGVAGGLLALGRGIGALLPLFCLLFALIVLFCVLYATLPALREKLALEWRKRLGDKGLARQMNNARLAQAMAMGMKSGLPIEEAVSLAAKLIEDSPAARSRCQTCQTTLSTGAPLSQALKAAEMLDPSRCRLLELSGRSGCADAAMERIAQSLSEESEAALEDRVSRLEPALVLVCSVLVGLILLSVMLPLMHIMAAIG